jgi:polar amino acid transport system substrate-binding protein
MIAQLGKTLPRVVAACCATVSLVSCGIPRDPEGTLDRVRGGTLRAGIAVHDPWTTYDDGEAGGIEAELIESFAEEIDATVEWTEGSEAELFEALELHELDVVLGGLTSTSPWSVMGAFTHPYLTTFVAVGVPSAREEPEDIAGVEVAAERGTAILGLLRKTDARAVEVDDITQWEGAAAVEGHYLEDLGLADTGVRLEESDHVMAVGLGENAWLTELERFLLERESRIQTMLEALEP